MAKVISIGDLHFGEKGDSEKFNMNVIEFLEWACKTADLYGCEYAVQLGDWFHHRNKINVQTLNYGIAGAKILGNHFGRDRVWVLAGNHDLHYLERLDVSSLEAISPYVTVVDDPETILPGCYATPWVTGENAWNRVVEASRDHKVLFAHLELNGFMVNDRYEMVHGASHRELKDYELVVTGHYHSLQTKDNVLYIGTPYPITMNEANESHGVLILDTETMDIEFVEYDAIKVLSVRYDELHLLEGVDPENTSVRIEFPDDIDDETVIERIKQEIVDRNFDEVKIKYRGEKAKRLLEADTSDVQNVENIDSAVIGFIASSSEVEGIDKTLLGSLYSEAIKREVA